MGAKLELGSAQRPSSSQPDRTEQLFMAAGGLPSWECKFMCIILAREPRSPQHLLLDSDPLFICLVL